jgi:hypothetical protein
MAKDKEFDLHVWAKPETRNMTRTYTVSIGDRPICVDMPIDDALDSIRGETNEASTDKPRGKTGLLCQGHPRGVEVRLRAI